VNPKHNIIVPFCIFLIFLGLFGNIILPAIRLAFSYNDELVKKIYNYIWFAGAIIGLLYSIIYLRSYYSKNNIAGKVVYLIIISVFIALSFAPFFR
jgi:hypothetical protein